MYFDFLKAFGYIGSEVKSVFFGEALFFFMRAHCSTCSEVPSNISYSALHRDGAEKSKEADKKSVICLQATHYLPKLLAKHRFMGNTKGTLQG